MRKLTTEEFIEKAKQVHGDKYDYSKVTYVNSHTHVCIICPEHGEFWQAPNTHLNGRGCKKCVCSMSDTESFIEKAKQVHGDKYDYTKVNYITNSVKVCIVCPEHGEFWQKPANHITLKQGCPKCKTKKLRESQTKPLEMFLIEAREVHSDKYDYSKAVYSGANKKICIICPEHGEFWQTPSAHINNKQGCPFCGRVRAGLGNRLNNDSFIEKANKIHNNKYDYSKVQYKTYDIPVTITCPIHGDFEQTPDAHLQGKGCPTCGYKISLAEHTIEQTIVNALPNIEFIKHNRDVIKPYELDFFVPDRSIAIEYNGIKWHSEEYKNDKNYHLMKTNACNEQNIKLIHIFEDEFHNSKEIVLNKLLHILGAKKNLPKIMARKCVIIPITANEASKFLTKFHIQGFVHSTVHYGAYYQGKLIAVMSFKKINNISNDWELTRFASDYNYIYCGVGGKLFKHFIREYNPDFVKSFADRRWTVDEGNNVYIQLGFKFDGYTPPDYKYVMNGIIKRFHKFGFRKKTLLKKYPDRLVPEMTETEMVKKIKAYKIYDCGLIRYVWKKEN